MRASLEHSKAALAAAPDQIHFKFNVAFVQIQIAQLIHGLPEQQRTLEEIDLLFASDSIWNWDAEKNFKTLRDQISYEHGNDSRDDIESGSQRKGSVVRGMSLHVEDSKL